MAVRLEVRSRSQALRKRTHHHSHYRPSDKPLMLRSLVDRSAFAAPHAEASISLRPSDLLSFWKPRGSELFAV